MMINPEEHCPPSEAKYAWKCPRCRGKCNCSVCRKARGLEPLGSWTTPRNKAAAGDGTAAEGESSKPKTHKAAKQTDGAADGTETAKVKAKPGPKPKPKGGNIAEAMAAGQKQNGKGKAKASTATDGAEMDEDDGISTPPPPGGKAGPKKTLASVLSAAGVTSKPRAPVFKPLKPPAEVAPPTFELIPTRLPEDNMRARMWIYESMVRFDKFGLNRTILSQLDKFENWTHTMAQDMLACLLKTIAGLSNIEKGQPTKPFVKAITAYRNHGKSLQKGEPWSAATELLAMLGLSRNPLPFVQHEIPVEVEAAAAERSPSPPVARVTRARRAKESNQYEIARQLSMLEQWEEDEFGETLSDANDDNEEDELPSKRKRTASKKSIYVYDDLSDDESMDDPDDSSRGRRSGRARKPVQKEPAPEVRLTGRQQAIKLQQEEEAAAAAKQRQQDEEDRARKGRTFNLSDKRSDASDSDLSGDESTEHKTNGHNKRRRLAVDTSHDEADPNGGNDEDHDVTDTKSNATVEETDKSRMEEMESPDLETKVSILSALIDAAVMADGVAEELKTAVENIAATERSHKATTADMEKEIAEELADLNKRAPSIVAPEYQEWKAEKQQLEKDIAWRRLDARVIAELAIDTHALRTGPMGYDVDGREYWHLREYQEKMPKFTEGRYAWCLVVLGAAFPVDPRRVEEEAKKAKEEADGDVAMLDAVKEAAKDEGDDSGLTSLNSDNDDDKAETEGEVKFGLPTSVKNGDLASTHDTNGTTSKIEDADSTKRICMGANDPATIKALIEYISFRLERVEYEENVALQDREKAVKLGKDGDSRSSSPVPTGADGEGGDTSTTAGGAIESMYSIRKAKQMLKESQEERRKQVEQLVKRLHKTKEYFAWHREELAP